MHSSHTFMDEDQKLLYSWLAVIGMLAMYWAPVESHIDQCVHCLHNDLNKKKPFRLTEKLNFIKKTLNEDVKREDIDKLSKWTLATVKIRDVCVHGLIESYDQSKIKIGKVDSSKKRTRD